jgi:hypothetical protein
MSNIKIQGKNGIYARVIEASKGKLGRVMWSIECRYHRYILSEVNTHAMTARSSSSSRAIPINTMLEQILNDPAVPVEWGLNQAGMQAGAQHSDELQCKEAWAAAAASAVQRAAELRDLKLHKQLVNRLLEAFMMTTTIISGTEWDNMFHLRCHPDAQPEFQILANCMREAMAQTTPVARAWHLPYITDAERSQFWLAPITLAKLSAARCARVSFENHDKSDPSVETDCDLFGQLAIRPYISLKGRSFKLDDPTHDSPLDHQAFDHGLLPITTLPLADMVMPVGTTHIQVGGGDFRYGSGKLTDWSQFRHIYKAVGESGVDDYPELRVA